MNKYNGNFSNWKNDPDVWVALTETDEYYSAYDALEKAETKIADSVNPVNMADVKQLLDAQKAIHRLEMEYVFKYGIMGKPMPEVDRE